MGGVSVLARAVAVDVDRLRVLRGRDESSRRDHPRWPPLSRGDYSPGRLRDAVFRPVQGLRYGLPRFVHHREQGGARQARRDARARSAPGLDLGQEQVEQLIKVTA